MHDVIEHPLISAHRGGRREAPENTVAAFAQAVEHGFRGVECDVYLSADSVPVVIHDGTVDRTTDGSGEIHTFTAAELGALDARGDFPDWPTREGVPTFADVLDAIRTLDHVEVEIKSDDPERIAQLVPLVLRDIDAAGVRHIIRFISFDVDNLKVCRKLAPDIPLLLTSVLSTPEVLQAALDLQCTGIAGSVQHLTQDAVESAHAAGLTFTCWTVNTAEDLAKILPWGVDVITTDCPTLIRSLLDEQAG